MISQSYFRLAEKHKKTGELKDEYNDARNLRTMGEYLKL